MCVSERRRRRQVEPRKLPKKKGEVCVFSLTVKKGKKKKYLD